MWIYLLLVCTILFMLAVSKKLTSKTNRIIYVLLCAIIIVLVGFRGLSVGSDSTEYNRIFLDVSNESFGEIMKDTSRFEKGFLIYLKMLSFVTTDYHFLFIVTAIVSMLPIFIVVYKYSKNYYFSLAIFVLLRFMFAQMNVIRQTLAIGILFIAFYFLIKKKRIPCLISIIIASTFHITAIVFVLLLLVSVIKIRIDRKNVRSWIVISILAYFLGDIIINALFMAFPQFYHYNTSEYFESNNLANFVSVLICFSFIALVLFYNAYPHINVTKSKNANSCVTIASEYVLNKTLIFTMLFSLIIFCLACKASLLDRVASYFYIFSIIYVPNIIEKYAKKDKCILYLLIVTVLISYFVITIVFRPEWNYVVPYVFWG